MRDTTGKSSMNLKGSPVAYMTVTPIYDTLEFECFYCRSRMEKKPIINNETHELQMDLKCPNHALVTIRVI